jgi:hypothetical protein
MKEKIRSACKMIYDIMMMPSITNNTVLTFNQLSAMLPPTPFGLIDFSKMHTEGYLIINNKKVDIKTIKSVGIDVNDNPEEPDFDLESYLSSAPRMHVPQEFEDTDEHPAIHYE